jgi:hypothetical protein
MKRLKKWSESALDTLKINLKNSLKSILSTEKQTKARR